jgi:transcriptional regulator
MYLPQLFNESSLAKLQDFVDTYDFGILFCHGAGSTEIVHMPFVLDRADGQTGALAGHVAKANPVWRLFDGATKVTVVFQGPHGYISPAWYVSHDMVPTWNYATVHVNGKPRLIAEHELTALLEALVKKHEGPDTTAWSIGKVREETLETLKKEIVGFKIPIDKIAGKFKLGQNRVTEDRRGAINGLRKRRAPLDASLADLMHSALESE